MTTPTSSENLFAELKSKSEETPSEVYEGAIVEEEEVIEAKPDELEVLKNRARLMGIKFSNNIGLESLKEKIKAKLDGEKIAEEEEEEEEEEKSSEDEAEEDEVDVEVEDPKPVKPGPARTPPVKLTAVQRKMQERVDQRNEQMKLIRVRITNLNPNKKNLNGEILTFANRILGTVRKFIPYGEATENGYHVPFCLYNIMKEREFVNIKTRKDSRGRTIVETGMAREFALEILPQLTEAELAKLEAQQAAAAGQD